MLSPGVAMRKWIMLASLLLCLSGCISYASDGYQPGIHGVRDLPRSDYCTPQYGFINNDDGLADRRGF
jgi:hypothetical protein